MPNNCFSPKIHDIILPRQTFAKVNMEFWEEELFRHPTPNNIQKMMAHIKKEKVDPVKKQLAQYENRH